MSELLRMEKISKRFGPTIALDEVTLSARSGEALALVGENGAGKSTLMKVLSGALAPDRGTITLAGRPFAPRGPHKARLAGVAMIYQELNIAPHLSVAENVLLGQECHAAGFLRRRPARALVQQAFARLGHAAMDVDRLAGQLSPGGQQLVEIARSLVARARVVVLDEPTSSLTQHDARQLFQVIRRLTEQGVAVIYISHFLEEIREVCQRFVVLRDGQRVSDGDLAEVTNQQIVSDMVGRSIELLFPHVAHTPGDVLLTVERLDGHPLPHDVSFELRRGEILGIAGLIGAGRTELLRAIYGLDPVRGGHVTVAGMRPAPRPRHRIRAGLGFVSEDRKSEGLAQNLSLCENITLSRLGPYQNYGWLARRQRRAAVWELCRRVQIKCQSPEQSVRLLSGGNQQKVALARVLHQDAEVLLLDEPTRGIDVATKAEIYRMMGQLAAQGKAVLFVSSYLPELLAVCDRIAVMARGRWRRVRPAAEWDEESIMACAVDLSEAN